MNRLDDQILEEFITQHRESLDMFEPPAEMWQHISSELDKQTTAMDEVGQKKEDQLESFIKDHQAELNLFEPPAEMWQRIDQELNQSNKEEVLEGFVASNKNSLDVFEPPTDLWQKISGELDQDSLAETSVEEIQTERQQEEVEKSLVSETEKLEQFVSKHKEDLQLFEPPADQWQKISAELDQDKTAKVITLSYRSVWKIASAAAAVVLVGFIGFKLWGDEGNTTGRLANKNKDTTQSVEKLIAGLDNDDLKTIDPELAEAESYYTEKIAEKKKELDKYTLEDVELKNEFKGDISELDSTYKALKKELYNVPSKEKVSEAMILNLQTRIDILNQQLKILEKAKEKKSQERKNKEKNSSKNEKMDI